MPELTINLRDDGGKNKRSRSADQIIKSVKALIKNPVEQKNTFPLEVFPEKVQSLVKAYVAAYQEPTDFYVASIMACASAMIGNRFKVRYKRGVEESPVLYTVLVGRSGLGKSPPMGRMLRPIKELQKQYWDEYSSQKAHYDPETGEPEPVYRQIMVGDCTTEALLGVLSKNPNGVLVRHDEFAGFLNGLNQYRSGGDVQFWLSAWDNDLFQKTRVSSGSILIDRLFASVIGGIQPAAAFELGSQDKRGNGFLSRLLLYFPEDQNIPPEKDAEVDFSVWEAYNELIIRLHSLQEGSEGILHLSASAKTIYKDFREKCRAKSNSSHEEPDYQAILSKMLKYCLRFALILELLDYAADENSPLDPEYDRLQISNASMLGAITLCQYFLYNTMRVLDILDNPLAGLPRKQATLYDQLPEEFSLDFLKQVAKEIGISNSTLYRLISPERKIFRRKGGGMFEKLY